MLKPDYNDGSIVNLMSSVLKAFNVDSQYEELGILGSDEIKGYNNVILFVMDGLGYESFMALDGLFMKQYLRGKMTSVFPPTTAACLTTFATGLPPQQTAVTSWYMNMKEVGSIVRILPYNTRLSRETMLKANVDPDELLGLESIYEKLPKDVKGYCIVPREYTRGGYSRVSAKGAEVIGYRGFVSMHKRLKDVLKSKKRKLIYCYSPLFDSACHEFGTTSKEATHVARRFDSYIKELSSQLSNDTLLLVTADHGLIDNAPENRINANEQKDFYDCLSMPLCGESRAVFCYVRPSKVKRFERIVKEKFKDAYVLKKGEELIKENYFGLGEPHPKLFDRIGDYVLIAKDRYTMKDFLVNDEESYFIANHGGLSKEELYVPLVVIKHK